LKSDYSPPLPLQSQGVILLGFQLVNRHNKEKK